MVAASPVMVSDENTARKLTRCLDAPYGKFDAAVVLQYSLCCHALFSAYFMGTKSPRPHQDFLLSTVLSLQYPVLHHTVVHISSRTLRTQGTPNSHAHARAHTQEHTCTRTSACKIGDRDRAEASSNANASCFA